MKVLLSVLFLVLITIIFSIYSYNLIQSNTNDLLSNLNDLEKTVRNNNWSKASSLNKKINNKWTEALEFLPIVINHAELHDLGIFIARISMLIELHEKEKLLTEIAAAKEIVRNIPLQEKLSIRNLL